MSDVCLPCNVKSAEIPQGMCCGRICLSSRLVCGLEVLTLKIDVTFAVSQFSYITTNFYIFS